jgi:mannose-6-phosphate isomerase-like protein (cupin superfamily)
MSESAGYIVRRGALDPSSGVEHPWGSLNFVSDRAMTGIDGVTVGMARIASGAENPLHIHANCSEIILLLSGSVEHVVGGDVIDLTAGDVLIVPAGVAHQARSVGSSPAEMVVVYDSGERGFQIVNDPEG